MLPFLCFAFVMIAFGNVTPFFFCVNGFVPALYVVTTEFVSLGGGIDMDNRCDGYTLHAGRYEVSVENIHIPIA